MALRKIHRASCPACQDSVSTRTAWSAERWMYRHERQCPDLAKALGIRTLLASPYTR